MLHSFYRVQSAGLGAIASPVVEGVGGGGDRASGGGDEGRSHFAQ
ncbi:MAG: hypothetical protein ACM37W_24380 [Actinomycetota bacterium]